MRVTDQKTLVRCTLRHSLRRDVPTNDYAEKEVKEKLLAVHIPVIAVFVIFLTGLVRYGDIAVLIDGQPYQFNILTKAR